MKKTKREKMIFNKLNHKEWKYISRAHIFVRTVIKNKSIKQFRINCNDPEMIKYEKKVMKGQKNNNKKSEWITIKEGKYNEMEIEGNKIDFIISTSEQEKEK